MSKARAAIAVLLLAGAGAAWAYRRSAGLDQAAAPEVAPGNEGWWDGWTQQLPSLDSWIQSNETETYDKVQQMTAILDTDANVRAFLEAIARAEGTAGQGDPYRVCYAYSHTIQSFSDHPAITGEWKGRGLSDAMCRAAGLGPGCVSTAAGKYQITKTTWTRLKRKLRLPDFSPASQDAAAIELLRETGALQFAQLGNVGEAVSAARRIWASLPGAGYEQPERSLAWVQAQYQAAGGVLA
jgi:lysozyme